MASGLRLAHGRSTVQARPEGKKISRYRVDYSLYC